MIGLAEAKKARAGKCSACKHYHVGEKDSCPAFPGGIPQTMLDGEHKQYALCNQWVEKLKSRELAEWILYLTDSKKGAQFRIVEAAKNGETPDPHDFAMLDNKPGRPHKDQSSLPFGDLGEWEILENYCELENTA